LSDDTLTLNGADWKVKDYYGEDWRWRDSHISVRFDAGAWYPAAVPGTVANDLLAAGEIPNPYFERNSRLIEWIPARTWVYRKVFTVDAARRGQRAQLRFEGIDYAAQIFLNGHDLGAHSGMYVPALFDVDGGMLNYGGENVLAVVILPAPHEEPQVGRSSRVRTHKSRMTYWWDFCPRMVHVGLWDDVTLRFSGDVRLDDVYVRPRLDDALQRADVDVTLALDARTAQVALAVEVVIRDGDAVVSRLTAVRRAGAGANHLTLTLPVDQPRLWYPNGHGDQPLYTAEVSLSGADGAGHDRRLVRFGIRRIEMIPNAGADPSARPYALVVNGQRVYIKGWNWVPLDAMYGVPRPEKLDHLLTLAQRAHVNLLRVWGGGLIEKSAFYERCDELGLLVWQEFIQSSSGIDNNPPTDPGFIAHMVREAGQIIPRRRNHPSLAIWCGGNELTASGDVPLDDTHPMLGALGDVERRLDPDRVWLPTSPTGPVFGNTLKNLRHNPDDLHDVHGPWEYQGVRQHYELYNLGSALLHSEFGVEGLTNLKSLNATVSPVNQFPVTLTNPVWQHLGAWWVKEKLWREVWGDVDNITTLVRATQWMQAEGLRYALEADRRRKYRSSGTLPWQFNEPFPMAACTSAVDYYQQPKPLYYAVAHAYEPLHVSARFEAAAWGGLDRFSAQVWVHSSLREPVEPAEISARVLDVAGRVCHEAQASVTVAPDSAAALLTVETALDGITSDVFFLDVRLTASGGERARTLYSFTRGENLAPLLHTPPAALDVTPEDGGAALRITNTGAAVALYVWIEDARPVGAPGYVDFDANHFCLLPGETRHAALTWHAVAPDARRLRVSGWNTGEWLGAVTGG
jgi:beta-mannosidase